MSQATIFIGGALTGMAALITAALTSNNDSREYKYTTCDKNEIKNMPATELLGYLNAYSTEALKLNMDLIKHKALNLRVDIYESPIFDLFSEKKTDYFSNLKENTLRILEKRFRVYSLNSMKRAIAGNFKKFRPVFVRANEIFKEHGMRGYSIDSSVLSEHFAIDCNLPVAEFAEKYQQMHSRLEDFLFKSAGVASNMIGTLPTTEPQKKPASSPQEK